MSATCAREVPEGCLSHRRVSLAAMGRLGPVERDLVDAHLSTCARCTELVRLERIDVGAAAVEPLPARIAAAAVSAVPPRRRWLGWLTGGLGVAATIAVVLVVTRPPDAGGDPVGVGGPDGVRLKGALSIEATVVRGDVVIAEDAHLDALGTLHDGDRLRLRVRNGAGMQLRIESFDEGRWQSIHTGVVPGDGWIPLGLMTTAGSETRLRVTVCKHASDLISADPGTVDPNECALETHTLDVR
ncbi:MAG: zf-HC2 domain-containing protein [Myxococcota bacterium]